MTKRLRHRLLRVSVSAFTLASLSLLMCGCGSNGSFVYEGKIYEDSYNFKNDYGYIYLTQTNEKAAKFYENIFLQMTEFNHKKQDVKEKDCHTLFYEQSFSDSTLTYDDLYQGYAYLTSFHPEYYWMGYTIDEENEYFALGISRKYAKASERKKFDKKLNSELKKIDKLVSEIEDKYDKIKTISDYIMDNMTYARDEKGRPSQEHWAHSITGFFDRRTGVCESYSKVFKLLCDRYEIGNLPVTSEDHIWNLVEYDNEWFVYDLTYDDDARNSYIGKTEEVYKDASHEYHKDAFKLPENMAKTPLSLSSIELKENGNTICKSHSMDYILSQIGTGKYEIALNRLEEERLTEFHISSINTKYEELTISSNQTADERVVLYVDKDITLDKDLTLSNLTLYSGKPVTITLDEVTIYLLGAKTGGKLSVVGGTIVNIE